MQAARLGVLALDGGITLEPTPLGQHLVLSLEVRGSLEPWLVGRKPAGCLAKPGACGGVQRCA